MTQKEDRKEAKGIENKTRIDPSFASEARQLHYNIFFSVIIIIIKLQLVINDKNNDEDSDND